MNGKIGFWRWLLINILKGIKTIPKLPKLMKDISPEAEMAFTPLAFLFPLLLSVIFGYPTIGILVAGALAFLLLTHAYYRMETEEDC